METSRKNILVTGGAGFIGSNLISSLLQDERVNKVRVLDNLSTGFLHNVEAHQGHADFEFIEGDIRDMATCLNAMEDIDLVSHQAALGSVPRSIKDPVATNEVNISGTLNIFNASVNCGVERVVFAASSSTYGDHETLPKKEDIIGNPLSPYAVTKLVNELYASVFSKTYNFKYIGLRYFNVFGPQQDPHGAYAAVVPIFFKNALEGASPTINGDGSYSRDYTYVENAIEANMKALFTQNDEALNQIYNVACGERTTLVELWQYIREITSSESEVIHGPFREGDIPHSLADISKANELLDYRAEIKVKEGLQKAYDWYKTNL